MAQSYTVKVLDQSHVAPPPGSVSTATIPLTFLDVTWLFCCPMNRLMFYEFPSISSLHFKQNIIPHLHHSLSLTLPHFFPLAGYLSCPPAPNKPYIQYNEGDCVLVTVAESNADFNHLVANHARDNTAFETLVPKLPLPSDKKHGVPVMAIQFTVFPNSGISIGITFFHLAADGRSFTHFMKSWASIHRSAGQVSLLPPCHDKCLIKDPDGLLSIYLKDWWNVEKSDGPGPGKNVHIDNVRVTLVLSRDQIDKLKQWVTAQIRNDTESPAGPPFHMSTFVVTSALMWVNIIKLQEGTETRRHTQDDDAIYHFVPVADCRERFEFPVPATYFGNCLAFLFVSAKRSELMGKDGIGFAAQAIGRKICELEKGALIGAEKWMSNLNQVVESGRVIAVAGSPKFGVYETDFGWGRPKKVEIVHMGAYGSFSIAEYRGEEGAIEIGLVIGRDKLDLFNVVFEQALNFNRP